MKKFEGERIFVSKYYQVQIPMGNSGKQIRKHNWKGPGYSMIDKRTLR
jgi:hypothetical protein